MEVVSTGESAGLVFDGLRDPYSFFALQVNTKFVSKYFRLRNEVFIALLLRDVLKSEFEIPKQNFYGYLVGMWFYQFGITISY